MVKGNRLLRTTPWANINLQPTERNMDLIDEEQNSLARETVLSLELTVITAVQKSPIDE